MSDRVIANRYAKALADLAGLDEASCLKQQAAFSGVLELFALDESAKILKSPIMPLELKKDLLRYALEQRGAEKLTQVFVEAIVDSRRVTLLPEVIRIYEQLSDEKQGKTRGKIVSSAPLEASSKDKLKSELERLVGKKIVLTIEEDQSLLGGFVAHVGNTLLDMSLRSRLDELTKHAAH